MLNVVKHLGCMHVDVHEILRFAQDDKWGWMTNRADDKREKLLTINY